MNRFSPLVRALAMVALLPCTAVAADPAAAATGRVREALNALDGFGPRPSGSPANARAAEWLTAELRAAGLEVRLGEGLGSHPSNGTSGRVRNIVGWLPARGARLGGGDTRRDAILVATHYDSIVDGAGGADNAVSVAAAVVAVRELANQPVRARPLVLLCADGEERGLLGADVFVREDSLADRVAAMLNFDHAGRGLPLVAYETAPPARALLDALWSLPRRSGAPRAFSFGADVYRLLPFDTDFTVLRTLGVPGLNFSLVGDGYAYHTERDRAADVSDEALQSVYHALSGMLDALVVRGVALSPPAAPYAAFFPVGPVSLRFTPAVLGAAAVVAVTMALVALIAVVRRSGRPWVRSLAAPVVAAPLGFVLMLVALMALRAASGVDQVAYAHPWPFVALLASLMLGAMLFSDVLVRNAQTTAGIRLAAVLPLWILAAVVCLWNAPSAAGFFVFPLLTLALAVWFLRSAALVGLTRTACAIGLCLLVLAATWAEPLAITVPFLMTSITKAGAEPLPFWPALATAVGLLLGPVPLAFVAERPRARHALVAVAGVAIAVSTVVIVAQPAYDPIHPLRAFASHVTTPTRSFWMVASLDRLSDLAGEHRGDGPELADLFWLTPRWSRWVEESNVRTPLPRASARRNGDDLVIEVDPPPGTDFLSLVVEGAVLRATQPASARLGSARVVLRQAVAGTASARFTLTGDVPKTARLRVMSIVPGLPSPDPIPRSRARVDTSRTLAVVDVVLP